MEPVDYQKVLDAEFQALIAAGFDIPTLAPKIPETVVKCCWKTVDKCQCTSTSSKEDEHIFSGSTYSLEEFAIAKHVMQLVSAENILSTVFTDINSEDAASEFMRFVTFIRTHPEPGRSELATLIYPVTIHLYALLMQDENIGVEGARTFVNRNANFLHHLEGYKEALAALCAFNDIEDLKQDSQFQHYIERKTVIKISKDVFKSLQDFIKSSKVLRGGSVLLSVLSLNFDFVDCDLGNCPEDDNANIVKESKSECKKEEIVVKGRKSRKRKALDLDCIIKTDRRNKKIIDIKNIKKEDIKNVKKRDLKNIKKEDIKNVKKRDLKNIEKRDLKNIEKRDLKNIEKKDLKNIEKTDLKNVEKTDLKNVEKTDVKDTEISDLKNLEISDLKNIEISELKNIEISEIVIYSNKVDNALITYDFDTEQVAIMDNAARFTDVCKKEDEKSIDSKPICRRNLPRNVSKRFMDVQRKLKELEIESKIKKEKDVEPNSLRRNVSNRFMDVQRKLKELEMESKIKKEKKEKEVEPNSPLSSIHSVDFNCAMSEIAYAVGDNFIYTLAIVTPKKKKKRTIKLLNDTTVVLRTFEQNESGLKSTRDPENEIVYVVKYLPGEPFYLLAAGYTKVRLFNTKTCSFLAEYKTDISFIYDIDVDSTGQYFATANHFTVSYIYPFANISIPYDYKRVRKLTGHEKAVTTVKFHPNGIYVATGSEDCTVRMFEVESGQCVRLFVGHLFGVCAMDFSYDGNLIASADSSGLVNVWDIKDCTVISKMAMRVKEEIYNVINSLCFHEKSFVLAASNEKGEIKFWNARNPDQKCTIRSLKKPLKIVRRKGKDWNLAYLCKAPREPVTPKKK